MFTYSNHISKRDDNNYYSFGICTIDWWYNEFHGIEKKVRYIEIRYVNSVSRQNSLVMRFEGKR